MRANDFVPSAAGAILLDDPRSKLAGASPGRLTVIASFGEGVEDRAVGVRVPAEGDVIGKIYQQGEPLIAGDVIGVPVVLGESICGVLELRGRSCEGGFTQRDLELLRIFAAYISSSIQNALDAFRARELARRDDLTGLYNDRFLHRRLTEEIVRTERDATGLALLFLDLDNFKHVNDTWGHIAGSRTLREVGRLISLTIPPGAVAARYGGDEFVIILPGANSDAGNNVGEAVRAALEATALLCGAQDLGIDMNGIRITVSVGVASYHEHVGPFGSLERRQNAFLRLADAAMYAAKSASKNRVLLALSED